jgi:hypothetical protein
MPDQIWFHNIVTGLTKKTRDAVHAHEIMREHTKPGEDWVILMLPEGGTVGSRISEGRGPTQ